MENWDPFLLDIYDLEAYEIEELYTLAKKRNWSVAKLNRMAEVMEMDLLERTLRGEKSEPREFLTMEVRRKFIKYISQLIERQTEQKGNAIKEMEHLAHDILAIIDGEYGSFRFPWILAPAPAAEAKPRCIAEGENWFPENLKPVVVGDISGSLHQTFHYYRRHIRKDTRRIQEKNRGR